MLSLYRRPCTIRPLTCSLVFGTLLFPLFVTLLLALYLYFPRDDVLAVRVIGGTAGSAPVLMLAMGWLLRCLARVLDRGWGQDASDSEAPDEGVATGTATERIVHAEEWQAITRRRTKLGVDASQWLCALSLPGGGIRQANFAIGVVLRLVAAVPRSDTPLWRNVDMVSAVSGGGYAATSLISHLLQPSIGQSNDMHTQNSAQESARLLRQHANWVMEKNWPRCLDGVMGCCCVGDTIGLIVICGIAVVAFLFPFVLLWSVTVSLLPVSLFFTIDFPKDCISVSAVWLADAGVVIKVVALLVFLRTLRFACRRQAEGVAAKVNQALRREESRRKTNDLDRQSTSEIDSKTSLGRRSIDGERSDDASARSTFQSMLARHSRFTLATHLFGVLFGACALAWLFAAAYTASGFNCGTFVKSKIKALDLSLLGSAALLIVLCQSQDAPGKVIPAALGVLGAMLMYSLACVHFGAWLRMSDCPTTCDRHTLGGSFSDRHHVYIAIALWGLYPILHNYWTHFIPRWYSWKLSRYLHSDCKSGLTLGELRLACSNDSPSGPLPPYLLLCGVVHHIWRLPRWGDLKFLKELGSATFLFSPLYVGGDSLGFIPTSSSPHNELRISAAAAISGAATSNHISQRSTQFHHLLTFFSGLLMGAWMQFEPNEEERREGILARTSNALLMIGCALVHFASAVLMLVGYEECTHKASPSDRNWACGEDGRRYVIIGFCFFVMDVCFFPILMIWVRPIWRTPWLGKWFSEWMQVQGFHFVHGVPGGAAVPRHVYLSDGGHVDNLGILEPLRRRSRLILCVHSGFKKDHLVGNLLTAVEAAQQDDSIRALFSPLLWDERLKCFKRQKGSLHAACDMFVEDMNRSSFVIGVEYAPYAADADQAGPFNNSWGLLVCLVNRPPSKQQCQRWDVDPPSEGLLDSMERILKEPLLQHAFGADQEQSTDSTDEEATTTTSMDEAFVIGPRQGLADMYNRVGVCCSCCHKRMPRCRSNVGIFPNHPTAVQCLTPEIARDYQVLGYILATLNEEMLKAAFAELRSSGEPVWLR